MKTYTQEVGNKLNTLLEKNYDAEKGYETASSNTQNPILTNFFTRKAKERKHFAAQLKSELLTLAQEPEDSGSIAGALHRTWMNTKALFTSDNDEAMLEEAIRGEKASIEDYDEVLNGELYIPESVQSILTNQKNTITNDVLTIKRLEDIK